MTALLRIEMARFFAKLAVETVLKIRLLESERNNSYSIVVMDPTKPYPKYSFGEAIFYQLIQVKNKNGDVIKDDDHEVIKIARSKAEISWRRGLPSQLVQQAYPYLLEEGDTTYGGSAVRDGFVVSCSGFPWQWDQAISYMVIDLLQAMSLEIMRDMENDEVFIKASVFLPKL